MRILVYLTVGSISPVKEPRRETIRIQSFLEGSNHDTNMNMLIDVLRDIHVFEYVELICAIDHKKTYGGIRCPLRRRRYR